MAIDNRFIHEELQPLPPNAYEVYWSLTEKEGHTLSEGRPFPSSDSLPLCSPGDAYNKLWQLWDAQ